MYVNNIDQENRTDADHPSLNVREFGYSKTTNIPDEFYHTIYNVKTEAYHCRICEGRVNYHPTAKTPEEKQLSLVSIFEDLTGTVQIVHAQEVSHHGVS